MREPWGGQSHSKRRVDVALDSHDEKLFLKTHEVDNALDDDVDVAMMVHTTSRTEDGVLAVGGTNNGMVAKFVRFLGKTSHAGGAPDQGINALSAAMLPPIEALRHE